MTGFVEAHAALVEGKRVRRKRWDRGSFLIIRNEELIWEVRGTGSGRPHQLDWDDMTASDWTILR
jgi:hypothetical protein